LGPNFLPESGMAPQWPAGEGPRVFAYLKAGHPDHAAVLQALDAAGCQVLCYLPEVNAGMKPPVVSPRIHYATVPVDLTRAFADAALAICHAGQATVVQSLLAGVPLLLLPMQSEQFLMARQVQHTGAGINAAMYPRPTDYKALVERLLRGPAAHAAARAFAARRNGFSHAAQVQGLLDRIEGLLPPPGRA
jgi:UDP:flavonoid glycosyltransferase YjiC (YdhE family)